MGQEFAQVHEWAENKSLDWEDLEELPHQQMKEFMKTLLGLYRQYPALYALDYDPEGFEWINCVDWEKSMVSFMRRTNKPEDTLVVVCNFSDVAYENHQMGVPYPGKYKEILNSDSVTYGGNGMVNPRVKIAKKEECDDRPYSIKLKVAPLSVSIFSYTKTEQKASSNKTAKKAVKKVPKSKVRTKIENEMQEAEKENSKE